MPTWLSALFESFGPQAVGGSEAVIGGGAAPMSFGDTLGGFAQNQISQQMAPAMDVYNTMTNPNSTTGDMARSVFKYSFDPKEDEKALMMPKINANFGGGMASNYVGGIPSILKKTNYGILPYIGSR